MEESLHFIAENPVYVAFLAAGGIGGIAAHFVNRKKYENFRTVTIVYAAGLILALLMAFAMNGFFNRLIAKKYTDRGDYYLTEFSFLYTTAFFLLTVKIFSLILGLSFAKIKEPFTASLLTFLCLAKLGCFFNGCCVSKPIGGMILHLNIYESGFALLLTVLYFWKKKKIFYPFFLSYLPYRFFSEFIRASYYGQKIFGVFTGTQLISAILFLFLIALLLSEKRKIKKSE